MQFFTVMCTVVHAKMCNNSNKITFIWAMMSVAIT